MGLWIERRYADGTIVMASFLDGIAVMPIMVNLLLEKTMELTIDQARQLARPSAYLPIEERDWVLRIRTGSSDET